MTGELDGRPPRHPLAWLEEALAELERQNLRRRLATRDGAQGPRLVCGGETLLNFGSNDYLSLAGHPRLAAACAEAAAREGAGAGASPLVTGRGSLQQELETALAGFERAEAALVFSSGFAANLGTVAALVGPDDVIFADRLNHASLIDGCRLSRAEVKVYAHNDCRQLEELLRSDRGHRRRLIVSDSLFSMQGDLAALPELARLARRYEAMLLIDEAHATGVFGEEGRGVAEHFAVEDAVHVRVGTLSKALGGHGGFVSGSRSLVEWLLNRARPYVFSTAPPAATCAMALAALELVRAEPQRRAELLARAAALRAELSEMGWNIGASQSQIIPLVVGQPQRALALAAALRQRGLFVPAIRPPSVPEGQSCLRISLAWGHTPEMIARLTSALAECLPLAQQDIAHHRQDS